ncbi:glycosyltransferase family protein [Niveispirillum fermenti]|uniref:glycosyltransferase family protein n=1 Tax=Niveispirillum fermenti TaxID=1233113 RepID=UPI003A86AC28
MSPARKGPRLALLNPIDPDLPIAERELALRLARATAGIGWDAAILSRSAQVEAMNPDAVLCLHPQVSGKLTAHPWLACYWNPPALMTGVSGNTRLHGQAFELTHDAYLVSGPTLAAHLTGLMTGSVRNPPTLPFHVSSPRSDLAPNLGPHSRLFYVGSNWDGRRYPSLLRRLAEAGALALYGTAERWSHLPEAYQGPLPFDGSSVIAAAHYQGMGLCLHLPLHRADGVPNMRVFELAAAGAVIIADRHPFIREWFGDTVLYVDLDEGEEAGAAHILEQVAWVHAHPAQARAMAAAAQNIFNRHLCLEALLAPLPGLLAELAQRRPRPRSGARVAVLLPGDGDPGPRLAQLRRQAGDGLSVTALVPGVADRVPPDSVAGVDIQALPESAGLIALTGAMGDADLLAVLPDGVEWHPGHLAALAAAVGRAGAALANGLWRRGGEDQGFPIDPEEDRAMPSPDAVPVAAERRLERAWLRAGGLACGGERLRDLQAKGGLEGGDWLDLALALAPALAVTGGLNPLPVPTLRLVRPPLPDPARAARLRPWACVPVEKDADQPPRLTGLNDLNPEIAASIPYLWRPADLDQLPTVGPIWLYGAGLGGELVLQGLPDAARVRLRGFLDSRRQGGFLDRPLVRPQDVDPREMAEATIIIAAQYVSDILRVLRQGVAPALVLNAYPYIAARQAEAQKAAVRASRL